MERRPLGSRNDAAASPPTSARWLPIAARSSPLHRQRLAASPSTGVAGLPIGVWRSSGPIDRRRPLSNDADRHLAPAQRSARLPSSVAAPGSLSRQRLARPPIDAWRSRVPIAPHRRRSPTAGRVRLPIGARRGSLSRWRRRPPIDMRRSRPPIDSGWSRGPHRAPRRLPASSGGADSHPSGGAGPYLRAMACGLPIGSRGPRGPDVPTRASGASFPSAATTVASCRPRLRPRVYRRRHPSAFVPNSATTAFSVVTATSRQLCLHGWRPSECIPCIMS